MALQDNLWLRVEHAWWMVRIGRARGDPASFWVQERDQQLFQQFASSCEQRGVAPKDLLMLHDDDLKDLFVELRTPLADRIVIRKYLLFPQNAVYNLWTAMKIVMFVTFTTFRLFRIVLGPAVMRGLLVGGAGVMLGVMVAGRRMRQIDFIGHSTTRRGERSSEEDFVNVSHSPSSRR